jgi:hypothetical protein
MPPRPPSDLDAVFAIVAETLPAVGIDCLLIGGFAVNFYGYSRSTLDIDLMILADRRDEVREIMKREGFTNVAVQANVTFFNRPGSSLRIDFLNTDQATLSKMLAQATWGEFHGKNVRVPALPDLLAMKFFALSQAREKRADKDVPDIAWLTVINGLDLESDLRPLALRFADDDVFRRVCAKIEEIKA